jgi:hypothetical protein
LDRLLGGRAHLSVTEREAMLEQVLQRAPGRRRRALTLGWVAAACATLAAVLVWVGPLRSDDELTARGGPLQPSFSVTCVADGRATQCRAGARLAFEVSPRGFAAFAAVAEAPDGTTVWLFPSHGATHSVELRGDGGTVTLPEAVELDGPPGDYTIHALFSQRPLSRDELRTAFQHAPPGDERVVTLRVNLP